MKLPTMAASVILLGWTKKSSTQDMGGLTLMQNFDFSFPRYRTLLYIL